MSWLTRISTNVVFPSLSETYQHIDLVHIAIAKSDDETTKNFDENVAETTEETIEETTTESMGKKLCL